MIDFQKASDLCKLYWDTDDYTQRPDVILRHIGEVIDTSSMHVTCRYLTPDVDVISFEFFDDVECQKFRQEFKIDKIVSSFHNMFFQLEKNFMKLYIAQVERDRNFNVILSLVDDDMSILPYKDMYEEYKSHKDSMDAIRHRIYEDFISRYNLGAASGELNEAKVSAHILRACREYYQQSKAT